MFIVPHQKDLFVLGAGRRNLRLEADSEALLTSHLHFRLVVASLRTGMDLIVPVVVQLLALVHQLNNLRVGIDSSHVIQLEVPYVRDSPRPPRE
jgi:hypothetical protein